MEAEILDGKLLAGEIRTELSDKVSVLKKHNIVPGLAVVLVGDDPASKSYVTAKEKACSDIGMYSRDIRLAGDTEETELLKLIETLNDDADIHGILVQLPLPAHIDEQKIIMAIDPSKDVDGFHPVSIGKMMLGQKTFLPCTPHGIIKLLEKAGVDVPGSEVVIVGRSNIVGKPLANMLIQKGPFANATVTVCHTGTRDLKAHTLKADIIIAAAGSPEMLNAEHIKEGAVVIDVGVNRVEDATRKRGYRLVGDVDFNSVRTIASHITPVPGGVGPMTITMLLYNTVESASERYTESD